MSYPKEIIGFSDGPGQSRTRRIWPSAPPGLATRARRLPGNSPPPLPPRNPASRKPLPVRQGALVRRASGGSRRQDGRPIKTAGITDNPGMLNASASPELAVCASILHMIKVRPRQTCVSYQFNPARISQPVDSIPDRAGLRTSPRRALLLRLRQKSGAIRLYMRSIMCLALTRWITISRPSG